MTDCAVDLREIWLRGYSIGEFWGASQPVSRGGACVDNSHLIMWGKLSIVDDQVRSGAGHHYLRDRLWKREWIAVGYLDGLLSIVPPIKDAKFGRKPSAVGDGEINYTKVRVLHARVLAAIAGQQHAT